ncbi:MAG: hypothetical protein WA071_29625 [Undibacterium umbellatum]|uniref:hypothetical protein n=1 Tax=Undibacterium umbellatum TaxID=2762300 RepID=UPI003BB7D8DE
MNHIEAIDAGLAANISRNELIRKIYLIYPTKAFVGEEEAQFRIFNKISVNFEVPIMNVQAAGSAKTGHSFHKQKLFTKGVSDLDVAIIDTRLFVIYMEMVLKETRGYSDRSGFPIKNNTSTFDEYIAYLSKGIFRPDLMPTCSLRSKYKDFFDLLSQENKGMFKSISAVIYMSQHCFESKQRSILKIYEINKAIK